MNITSQVDVQVFSARPKVDVDLGGRIVLHFMTDELALVALGHHILDNLSIAAVESFHNHAANRIRAESW